MYLYRWKTKIHGFHPWLLNQPRCLPEALVTSPITHPETKYVYIDIYIYICIYIYIPDPKHQPFIIHHPSSITHPISNPNGRSPWVSCVFSAQVAMRCADAWLTHGVINQHIMGKHDQNISKHQNSRKLANSQLMGYRFHGDFNGSLKRTAK